MSVLVCWLRGRNYVNYVHICTATKHQSKALAIEVSKPLSNKTDLHLDELSNIGYVLILSRFSVRRGS